MSQEQDQAVLQAVKEYVYNRHSDLTLSSTEDNFDEEELDRLETTEDGYLVFTVDDLQIVDREDEEDGSEWFVKATLYFAVTQGDPIEGSTDVYRCYQTERNDWYVEYHATI